MSYLDQITVDSTTYDLQDSGAQRVTLTGSSAPTTSTVGVVGQHYINTSATSHPYEYVCTAVSSNTYTWVAVDQGAAPVTSVNNKTGAVSLTATDVGALPDSTSIPTKTSDLTNDSGFVTTDNKVEQNIATESSYTYWRPLVIGASSNSSETGSFTTTTDKVYGFTGIRVQPSSGTIKATTFKGNLTGNVTGNVTGDVTGTASGNYSASNPPPYPVTSVNGNTGAVTIPDEIYIGTTTPTDSGVDVWIDTGSSGTLQNVVCSVDGISPTSSGNVDLIPGNIPTYYIDGTNGSDSNDGSQSRPFATINKALDLIKAYKVQTVYPAIVYIAEGTYDEFLDLRRLPLEFNINLQGDVIISGILCVNSACFINGEEHKLTVQNSSNVTYPWGKMLISVNQGSTFDIKSGSSGSVELKTTDSNFTGISVGRECNFCIQKAVFTNTTNTFAYPINIDTTKATIGSIVSSGTNIGRIHDSGTLFIGDINGGVNYTGTTIDATSRIIFKPVKSVCSKTPDANGDVALVSSDVGAMGAWTLLWSNASPTSSFAAQTVSIDLSNYDFVAVKFLADTSSGSILYNKMQIRVVRVGDGGWAEHLLTASTDWPGGAYNGIRPFETSSSGVTFSACLERGSTHNTTEIPQEIYGIKGVITAIS